MCTMYILHSIMSHFCQTNYAILLVILYMYLHEILIAPSSPMLSISVCSLAASKLYIV